jgi:hypothetical protein
MLSAWHLHDGLNVPSAQTTLPPLHPATPP